MGKDIQVGTEKCPANPHTWMGDNPHALFEQCQPAVNKEEPLGFANPCEAGAKKASEETTGMRTPARGVCT